MSLLFCRSRWSRRRPPIAPIAAATVFALVATSCATTPNDVAPERDARQNAHSDAPTPDVQNPFLAPIYPSSDPATAEPARSPDVHAMPASMSQHDSHTMQPATMPASLPATGPDEHPASQPDGEGQP